MLLLLLLDIAAMVSAAAAAASCSTDLDCQLNGLCKQGQCLCDAECDYNASTLLLPAAASCCWSLARTICRTNFFVTSLFDAVIC